MSCEISRGVDSEKANLGREDESIDLEKCKCSSILFKLTGSNHFKCLLGGDFPFSFLGLHYLGDFQKPTDAQPI